MNESTMWFEAAKASKWEQFNVPLGRRGRLIFVVLGLLLIPSVVFASFILVSTQTLNLTAKNLPNVNFDNAVCSVVGGTGNITVCDQGGGNLTLTADSVDDDTIIRVVFDIINFETGFNVTVSAQAESSPDYVLSCPSLPIVVVEGAPQSVTCDYALSGISSGSTPTLVQSFDISE